MWVTGRSGLRAEAWALQGPGKGPRHASGSPPPGTLNSSGCFAPHAVQSRSAQPSAGCSLELGSHGHGRGQGAGRPRLLGLLPCWALGVLAVQQPPPTCLASLAPAATGRRLSGSHCMVRLQWFSDWHPGIWPAVSPSDPLSPHSCAPPDRLSRESAGPWAEPPGSDKRDKGSRNCLVKKPGRKKTHFNPEENVYVN